MSAAERDPIVPTDPMRSAGFKRDVIPLIHEFYRQALKLTRDPADAEDLLQETAAKAFAGFHGFRTAPIWVAWLYRILVNSHISSYRKQQRRPDEWLTEEFTDGQLVAEGPALLRRAEIGRGRSTRQATTTSGRRCRTAREAAYRVLRRRRGPSYQGDRRTHRRTARNRDDACAPCAARLRRLAQSPPTRLRRSMATCATRLPAERR